MKSNHFLLAFLLVLVLPCILLQHRENDVSCESQELETISKSEPTFHIRVKDKEDVFKVSLEDYVLGVVLGEMPASFEEEALKAQAVATRTYTLRKIMKQDKHSDADVCTDASCCQAYFRKNDYLATRGTAEDFGKIEAAVKDTKSQVLYYHGELIEATYFSCSGGMTEDAVAVWGSDVPYLASVASPGEDSAKHFATVTTYTKDDFFHRLGLSARHLTADDITFTYTSGGGVMQMQLFGASYTGTRVRELLKLPSTAFSVSIVGDNVIINSKGYGHRVGMSQYGADAMALNGSTYDEILSHYYGGTTLEYLSESDRKAIFDKEENL